LGLAASFRSRGHVIAPFKKGPDYIDAAWLTRASGHPCRNLDLFLFSPTVALSSFADATSGADLAIIEGNRGLFDGMDPEGTYSSAELAKLLHAPVLLSIDVTKTTRTAAAQVLGCQTLDPAVPIGGVVLNRVAGKRHETVLREAIEGICGVPVLGAIPNLSPDLFPERHLGLVPPQETEEAESPLARVGKVAEDYLDLEGILKVATSAEPIQTGPLPEAGVRLEGGDTTPVRIGIFRDAAFQFYYPENLEELERGGGELVEISPLQDSSLPDVDALYLGGGFPETLAPGLSQNIAFIESVRGAGEAGLPIYAECGGAVYLGRALHYRGRTFPLVGVLPVDYGFQEKPKGHGYAVLETVGENPFFPPGKTLRGHEFHYTHMIDPGTEDLEFAFKLHRGYGFDGQHDGLRRKNVLACYTHLHALGAVDWAPGLLGAARRFRSSSSR
jgi:cobyrinic acid a,c-diamide synthase